MPDDLPPLILEPAELDAMLRGGTAMPVGVVEEGAFRAGHIPGSVQVPPRELMGGARPAVGRLPDAARLEALCSRIGLGPDRHVVAWDDEGGGWAGRLVWTLDAVGHRRRSFLNGGLAAWAGAGLPLARDAVPPAPSPPRAVTLRREVMADLDEVRGCIGRDDCVIWDARSAGEYLGTRSTALRNGHIPGAVHLDWLELVDRDDGMRLRPLESLRRRLESLGVAAGKRVITHCHTHHRSGLSYLVGRALGLDIRAYDGSWSEWGNRTDTPVEGP